MISFSRPFATHGTWTNDKINPNSEGAAQTDRQTVIGFYGSYPATAGEQSVEVRIGMSYVDEAGARKNLDAEMPDVQKPGIQTTGAQTMGAQKMGGDFEFYRARAARAWDEELRAIEVEGGTLAHRRIFYTALYHALIAPTIFEDVDRRYTGFDGQIHSVAAGHEHFYATFSGWDIYRTQMPLLGIIKAKRAGDMAQSIVEMAKQLGYIDRWPQLNQPTGVMNGDPLTIVLVNLWNAGIRNFDMETAYKFMWKQAQVGDPGARIGIYQGFAEEQKGITLNADASVASALEYNVAFAALGNLARDLGKPDDARYLWGRALQYRQMYNPVSGYLQGRNGAGEWDRDFGGYTEGNRDIYLWFVPHDVQGLVDLLGGPPTFERRLDEFFSKERFDPTNEPDIGAPFLYDYINRPWKTQAMVARTADRIFADTPAVWRAETTIWARCRLGIF